MKRNILLTPGPATTTDSVKQAQIVPDICPREREFARVLRKISRDLVKIVKGGAGYTGILFAGSGTSAMEACINSVVPPAGKLAVVQNGAYGERMVRIAQAYSIPCVEITFKWGERLDTGEIKEVLKKDKKITSLAMVHHETTTGILNPLKEIGGIARENNCTFIVDAVSSFAGIPIDIKECQVDFMFSASNKCIQGMAGVAFVICKKNELEKTRDYSPRSFYLNLYQQYDYFKNKGEMQFTAPVQAVYALRQAIKEYFDEGGENRYKRYRENWKALRAGLEDLGFKFLLDKKDESCLLTTIREPEHKKFDFNRMHDSLYRKGFTVYPGKLGGEKTFRLANIGAINKKDIGNFLIVLGKTLKKIGVKLNKKSEV